MKVMAEELIEKLKDAVHEGTLKRYRKNGEREPYIGVPMGAIRTISKEFKKNPEIFMDLFRTDILDAKVAAVNIAKPDELTEEEVLECIKADESTIIVDKFSDKILTLRKDREKFKELLMKDKSPIVRRYAWNLIIDDLKKCRYSESNVEEIIKTVEERLEHAEESEKWAMNHAIVEAALNYPQFLDRILKSSEKIGAYKDMKVSKGCTSPYAPEWINAVLKKKK